MYQQERMDAIMKILKENHYATVDYLVEKIRYSPASIRRDLTLLEKQGLVKRSYGGVTLGDANISPYRFRQHSMKTAKNAISKKAAELVKEGDTIFFGRLLHHPIYGTLFDRKKGYSCYNQQYAACRFFK